MQRYGTIEKRVGETPLETTERFRRDESIDASVPLAYAGRLDPMASGKLLILIGEECKHQERYHGLDKEYEVEILFGIKSDTGDVLGITETCNNAHVNVNDLKKILKRCIGNIELPYPHFSAKTVLGKPLHVWTLEGRLGEIEIPKQRSRIYSLSLNNLRTVSRQEVVAYASEKIETVTTVTEESKALGRDFRRTDVRAGWASIGTLPESDTYTVATITCKASSGTYMRSLAEHIAAQLGTCALAYSIRRTKIGKFLPLVGNLGMWTKKY